MSAGIVSIMAGASAFVGVAVGLTIGGWRNKRLRRQVRDLRLEKRAQPQDNAVFYQTLDELEGERPSPPTKKNSKGGEPNKPETMKLVVWVCLAMGIAWVWCSYILAYLDHPQIAESLSQVAVTEIIGVVLAYAIKSSIENLSKHNSWPDKQGTDSAPPDGVG